MGTEIITTEIDIDQLFIDEKILPKARKRESGEMVTSRKELMDKLRAHGLQFSRSQGTNIISILEQSNKITYPPGRFTNVTLLINPEGIQNLIDLVNKAIQDTWDDSEVIINNYSRPYPRRGQRSQYHFQW